MHILIRCIIFISFLFTQTCRPKDFCILVHGTWICNSNWHLIGGDFYSSLQQTAQQQNIELISFCWSGKAGHKSRIVAGKQLADFIERLPDDENIIIIAHSHGANIVFIATEILAQSNSAISISRLYTLGTPISKKKYIPNMNIIQRIYHLFSFGDFVQPVFGLFDRQFDPHERIANLRLIINGKEPGHSELHDPLVGKWLLSLHSTLEEDKIGNFDQFNFITPGIVTIATSQLPTYAIDFNRNYLIEQDKKHLAQARKNIIIS